MFLSPGHDRVVRIESQNFSTGVLGVLGVLDVLGVLGVLY